MTVLSDMFVMLPEHSIKLWESGELELGDFGFSVQRLQEILIKLGFYDGPIDGYLSPETSRSIRKAQNFFRLKTTGRCDALTWQMLQTYSLKSA